MPRAKHADPPVRLFIHLPQSLAAELELRCYDPVSNRMRYGMRSEIIQRALRDLFAREKEEKVYDTGS